MKCIYLNPILEAGMHSNVSLRQKVYYTGYNTGNMVFVDAIKQQIVYEKEERLSNSSLKELSENHIGVLSCANMINVNDPVLESYMEIRYRWKPNLF